MKNDLLQLELTPREMQWMYSAMKNISYVNGFSAKENAEVVLTVDAKMEKAWTPFMEKLKKEQAEKDAKKEA